MNKMKTKYIKRKDGVFMEKVEFKIKKTKKVIVKFEGCKVEIKPYIDTNDMVNIASIVYDNYYKNEDVEARLLSSPIIENAYLVGVIDTMTNINVKQEGLVDYLINSGFVDILKGTIINYYQYLNSMYYAIGQKNNLDRFNSIADSISEVLKGIEKALDSNEKDMNKNVNDIQKNIEELQNLRKNGLKAVEEKKDKTTEIKQEDKKEEEKKEVKKVKKTKTK